MYVLVTQSCVTLGLQPTRLPLSWSSPGKNTGDNSYSFLQGIFLTHWIELESFKDSILPKAPSPNIITLKLGFNMNFEETHIFKP